MVLVKTDAYNCNVSTFHMKYNFNIETEKLRIYIVIFIAINKKRKKLYN